MAPLIEIIKVELRKTTMDKRGSSSARDSARMPSEKRKKKQAHRAKIVRISRPLLLSRAFTCGVGFPFDALWGE